MSNILFRMHTKDEITNKLKLIRNCFISYFSTIHYTLIKNTSKQNKDIHAQVLGA